MLTMTSCFITLKFDIALSTKNKVKIFCRISPLTLPKQSIRLKICDKLPMDDDNDIPDDIADGDDIEVVELDEEIEDDDRVPFDIREMEEFEVGEETEEIETEVVDMSKLTFAKHGKSVFSADVTKDGALIVTGGEDDMAYIWSANTGEVVLECTGHKDSVTEVGFNFDGQFVATADMAGLVQVWSVKEKKLVWCSEGDDMEWMQWHHLANVLIIGCHSGDIYIWQIPQGNCKVLPSHGSLTMCGKVLADGKRLISGYMDGQLKLWDIKATSIIWQLVEPQRDGITSLDLNKDNTLALSAPTAQVIKISDGKPVASLLKEDEKEVEAVMFNSDLGVAATGSLSGQLCVWDIGKYVLRHQAKIESSVTVIEWGKSDLLFVGATDGAIYVCDARSGTLVDTFTGHTADILSIIAPETGDWVLTTSDDGTAKIFAVKK